MHILANDPYIVSYMQRTLQQLIANDDNCTEKVRQSTLVLSNRYVDS